VTGLATTIISGSTLLQLVVYALVAGLGVMGAFSALIYCVERAQTLRRADERGAAALFQAAAVLAMTAVVAIVVYGLVLLTSKPK
jgi:hypothetical protein